MVEIKIDSEKCIGCGACINACPVELFLLTEEKAIVKEDTDKCILCMACITSCPTGAIKVSEE